MPCVASVVQDHLDRAVGTSPEALPAAFAEPKVDHLYGAVYEGKGLPSANGHTVPAAEAIVQSHPTAVPGTLAGDAEAC